MKLYFIRHGQTDWNLEGKLQGSYDSELNATGIEQANELGSRIAEYKISKIYSSKQKRALKTAQILSKYTNTECIEIDGFEEVRLGEWEGLLWDDLREKYPSEYDEWINNRRYSKPHKGESYNEVLERTLKALEKVVTEGYNEENIAIVSHGAVIACLQCYLANEPFEDIYKFKVENTSIIEIDSSHFDIEIHNS